MEEEDFLVLLKDYEDLERQNDKKNIFIINVHHHNRRA
jgi:hypothetical protein